MLAALLRSNAPLIAVAIVLILVGLSTVVELSSIYSIARYVVAIMAGAAGVYIIYSSMMSRSKVDDLLGALLGILLLGVAAYLGFGYDVFTMIQQYASALQSMVPWIVAATMSLVALWLVQRRGIYTAIGIFLLLAALAIMGIKLSNLFGW